MGGIDSEDSDAGSVVGKGGSAAYIHADVVALNDRVVCRATVIANVDAVTVIPGDKIARTHNSVRGSVGSVVATDDVVRRAAAESYAVTITECTGAADVGDIDAL